MALTDKQKNGLLLFGAYLAMVTGMAAKAVFDYYAEGTPLSMKIFMMPLLVSPIVYGAVFKVLDGSDETLLVMIFGFQNGFFWQDIFGQLGANGGGGG